MSTSNPTTAAPETERLLTAIRELEDERGTERELIELEEPTNP